MSRYAARGEYLPEDIHEMGTRGLSDDLSDFLLGQSASSIGSGGVAAGVPLDRVRDFSIVREAAEELGIR